jgi:peroxiredoxin 2/4
MKNSVLYLILLSSFTITGWSQDNNNSSIPLLGETVPSFTAQSTNGDITFPADYSHQWKILFCHPADFTPVCTSEIIELANDQKEFSKLNTKILIVSTDALDNHKAWVKSMESLTYKGKTPEKIKFPLVADMDRSIARKYGMIHPATNSTKDVRGVFIIDPNDKLRAMFFYPMEVGRNIPEVTRTLLALQTAQKETVLTPANWKSGEDVIVPYLSSTDESTGMNQKTSQNTSMGGNDDPYKVAWYLWLKKLNNSNR